MGLSGSGKSTLVRHINRLIDPSSGEILVDGENVLAYNAERLRELRRKRISMVFQSFGLLPHRNVLDNVAYGLAVRGESKAQCRERAAHWVEAVGLQGYQRPFRTSCPAACASASGWPGRWRPTPTSSSWTKPSAPWTR